MTPQTSHPVPAFHHLADAVEHYLAHDSALHERYRYAPAGSGWVRPTPDSSWTPVASFEEVKAAAKAAVREALTASPPPLAFRCVYAPRDSSRVPPWQTVTFLETVTSWEEAVRARPLNAEGRAALERWRAAEADRALYRAAVVESGGSEDDAFRAFPRRPFPADLLADCISQDQRLALLRRLSTRVVDEALRAVSHAPPFLIQSETERVAPWAPEAFVGSLRRVPGARLPLPELYRAYEAQVPPGEAPIPAKRFHRLVRHWHAPVESDSRGTRRFHDLALPESADPDRPALRLVV